MPRPVSIDPIKFIKENYKTIKIHSAKGEDVKYWAKIFNTTPNKIRYILDKLVKLDVVTRSVHETRDDMIDHGINLNIKTAEYYLWYHKMSDFIK